MPKRRAVVSINSRGEIVGAYSSIMEAVRINQTSDWNIIKAIKNKTYHRKHLWMYEEDYRPYWMEGRLDELRNSWKKFCSDRTKKAWANLSEEKRAQRIAKQKSTKRRIEKDRKQTEQAVAARRRPIMSVTTGEVFDSVSAFAKAYGTYTSNASKAAKSGTRIKGVILKYL